MSALFLLLDDGECAVAITGRVHRPGLRELAVNYVPALFFFAVPGP